MTRLISQRKGLLLSNVAMRNIYKSKILRIFNVKFSDFQKKNVDIGETFNFTKTGVAFEQCCNAQHL